MTDVRLAKVPMDMPARSFITVRCCLSTAAAESPVVPSVVRHHRCIALHDYCMYREVHCTLFHRKFQKLLPLQCKGYVPHCAFECSYWSFNRKSNLKSIFSYVWDFDVYGVASTCMPSPLYTPLVIRTWELYNIIMNILPRFAYRQIGRHVMLWWEACQWETWVCLCARSCGISILLSHCGATKYIVTLNIIQKHCDHKPFKDSIILQLTIFAVQQLGNYNKNAWYALTKAVVKEPNLCHDIIL